MKWTGGGQTRVRTASEKMVLPTESVSLKLDRNAVVALYADFGVSIASSRQEWSCRADVGSRKNHLVRKHVLRLNFNTK